MRDRRLLRGSGLLVALCGTGSPGVLTERFWIQMCIRDSCHPKEMGSGTVFERVGGITVEAVIPFLYSGKDIVTLMRESSFLDINAPLRMRTPQ